MIKGLLNIIFLTLILTSAKGQTNITAGNVKGMWTKAGSPYIISGYITVGDYDTLRIQPGVKVQFSGDAQITIRGKLKAVGTVTDSIEFSTVTSATPDLLRGRLNYVFGASFLVDSNILKYCKFLGRVYVSSRTYTNLTIENCHFSGFSETAVSYYQSKAFIQNTTFENSIPINNVYPLSVALATEFGVMRNCNFIKAGGVITGNGLTASLVDSPLISVENCQFKELKSQAIEVQGGVNTFIRNNIFQDNTFPYNGSAISVRQNEPTDTLYIENNIFKNNKTGINFTLDFHPTGTSIYLSNPSFVEIKNNFFENNDSKKLAGGAICISRNNSFSRVNITDCQFKNNSSGYGGAIYGIGLKNFTINRCAFINNTAKNYGGAISLFYTDDVNPNISIQNSLFANNETKDTSSNPSLHSGGAIYLKASPYIKILNSTFINNRSSDTGALAGGAIFMDYIHNRYSSIKKLAELSNNIFYGNRAMRSINSNLDVNSNIGIYTNQKFDTLTINNSCIEGGASSIASEDLFVNSPNLYSLNNCISSNPQLIAPTVNAGSDYDASTANFRLNRRTSPVINRGRPLLDSLNLGLFDLDLKARILDDTIDMGAYEAKLIRAPEIIAQTTEPLTLCAGMRGVMRVSVQGIAPFTYIWKRNGTTVGTNSDSLVIAAAAISDTGSYVCQISNVYGNVSTVPIRFSVNPLPILTLNRITDSLCQNGTEITLVGSPSGGSWSGTGVTNRRFSPQTSGVGSFWLKYTLTDANGCTGQDSIKVIVRNCRVGLAETFDSEGIVIKVFPNPSYGKDIFLSIKTTKKESVTVELFDIMGRSLSVLLKNELILNERMLAVSTLNQSGIMIAKISVGGKIFYSKLIH